MAETKPRSEQIRFISDKTGENVLDTYLEACERVGIPLSALIDVIFDSVGNVNPNFIQFRIQNPSANVYTFQFRSGIFVDPEAGWQTITATVFQDLINTANTAVTNATAQATLASQWASLTTGQVATTDYSSKAWAIGGTGVTNTAARGAAKEWATKTTGTVDTSEYAAKAWAIGGTGVTSTTSRGSAKDWAILGTSPDGSANLSAKTYATNAGTSATNAATSEANALTYANQAIAAANGMKFRDARAATTANITLSAPQTIDGVSVIAGDRVLVKNQSTAANNGIYQVNAGAWTRVTDMDTWAEVVASVVVIQEGTTLADSVWICTANSGGTLGSTAITFLDWSAAILAGTIDGTKLVSSIALAGSPTTTTQAINDNTTKIATTAYVDRYANGFPISAQTDLNNFATGTFLTANTGMTNLPATFSQGRHIVETFASSGYQRQVISGASPNTGQMAVRGHNGTSWGAWRELAGTVQTDFICGEIDTAANRVYNVCIWVPFAFTITAVTAYAASGSCTVLFGRGVGGGTNTVATLTGVNTTTQRTGSLTNATGAAGDYIYLVISSNASAKGVAFSIDFTRTLV